MTTTSILKAPPVVPPPIFEHPIQAHQIPYVIEQLGARGKDASWVVFIFDTSIRSPLTDDPYPNLQYSVINGVVGLDWVLLRQRNIADQEKLTRFLKRHRHKVAKQCQNEVFYLRVEDGDLSSLGTSIGQDFYGVAAADRAGDMAGQRIMHFFGDFRFTAQGLEGVAEGVEDDALVGDAATFRTPQVAREPLAVGAAAPAVMIGLKDRKEPFGALLLEG